MSAYRYVRALDGVRGLAIVLVVLDHSAGQWFVGGSLGVDVFFVLSGFLITGILLHEREKRGVISLRNFYARRALRLVPALLALLALVAILPWIFPPATTVSKLTAIVSTLCYVSNYVQTAGGASLGNLGHTWSLSVEEQFYILWPLTMIWLMSRSRLKAALYWLIFGFMVVRFIGVGVTGLTGDGWLSSHADELLIGALLAALWQEEGLQRLAEHSTIAWTGLAVLAILFVVMDFAYRAGHGTQAAAFGVLSLAAVSAAALIAHLATGRPSAVHKLFSSKPLVVLGKVSYGIYLYHLPIFNEVRYYRPLQSRSLGVALEYLLTAVVVAASWHLLEKPALRLKRSFSLERSAPTLAAKADSPTQQVVATPPELSYEQPGRT